MSANSNYEAEISSAAEKKEDRNISNASFQHAKLGIKHLFKNAGSTVRLISSEFYAPFWEQLVPDIQEFLSKDQSNRVRIIILKCEKSNQSLLSSLVATGRVDVSVFSEKSLLEKRNIRLTSSEVPNFMVLDTVGYRLELSDAEMSDKIVSAVINFGDENTTKRLVSFFDILSEQGVEPLAA